jgi:hypothetical protein
MTRVPQKSCGALYRQFVKHSAVYVKIDLEGNQWVLGWCLRTQTLWHDSIVRKTDFKLTQNYRAYFRLLSICRVGTYFFFKTHLFWEHVAIDVAHTPLWDMFYAFTWRLLQPDGKTVWKRLKLTKTVQTLERYGKSMGIHGVKPSESHFTFMLGVPYIYTHTKFHLYIYTNVHL